MCIIIDTNSLSSVFKEDSIDHQDFRPIKEWVINGNGKIIYGGTKYIKELKNYLSFFNELRKSNKAILIDNYLIDKEEIRISKIKSHRDLDDQHIIGLLSISKCKLICSKDTRAHKFFLDKELYPKGFSLPKIYSSLKHSHLLTNKNIADCCIPCIKLNKSDKTKFFSLLK